METFRTRVKEGAFKFLASLYEILSNPTRLGILDLLYRTSDEKTFSDIMFTIRKNPNVVSKALKVLQEYKLIEKTERGYKITEEGKFLLNMNARSVMELVKKGLEITTKSDDFLSYINSSIPLGEYFVRLLS